MTEFFKPVSSSKIKPSEETPRLSIPTPNNIDKNTTAIKASHTAIAQEAPIISEKGTQESAKLRVIPSSDGELSSDDELADPASFFTSFQQPRPRPIRRLSLSPPRPKLKSKPNTCVFSLDKLLAEKHKSFEIEANCQKAQKLYHQVNNVTSQPYNIDLSGDRAQEVAEEFLGSGDGAKLIAALARKDGFKVNQNWEFFKPEIVKENSQRFPHFAVVNHNLFSGMTDVFTRNDMFLSGFVQDIVSSCLQKGTSLDNIFPQEVIIWMVDQLCLEHHQALSFAYWKTLEILPLPAFNSVLSSLNISRLFELLGATKDALNLEQEIKMLDVTAKAHRNQQIWNAKLLVRFLGAVVDVQYEDIITITVGLLVRLALDAKASAMLILSTIKRPESRIQVLRILPINSPRLHLHRRRLALSFLFEDGSYMSRDYGALLSLDRITSLLRQPHWAINPNTNYETLKALVAILDIGLDTGATNGTQNLKDRHVDDLTDTLRQMFSRIVDTNAQNIARTETKDGIERIQFRLTFSIRSRQKMALDPSIDSHGNIQGQLKWAKSEDNSM
ncbi:hypothetical protein EDC01DRAFT_614812 [Geopyxis carbonaria]|nr:hypothetical protein EDC01DRAFT_614812 [Geopyxis carbonaria]